MNINRDNYEEFFLLYTDNELSASERTAVEDFILQNPDLKEELMMLQEAILLPEPVSLENKGALLHAENISSSLQEKMLLLLDDELDTESKTAIKTAIKTESEIEKEWLLLQQTKLSANEKIIFTDKAVLYKKEKGKLIPMGWRIAAAAVLIGFGLWSTFGYLNRSNNGSGSEGFATNPAGKPVPKEAIKNIVEHPVTKDLVTPNIATTAADKISNDVTQLVDGKSTKSALSTDNKKVQPSSDLVSKVPAAINKKPSNNLPEPGLEKINNVVSNNNDVATVPSVNTNEVKALGNPGVIEAAQPYAINTAFTDNKDEKITYGFEEEEDQPKKTKVGGFFKKLNRVLQRKANIKTGNSNSFKVANLSFAVQ